VRLFPEEKRQPRTSSRKVEFGPGQVENGTTGDCGLFAPPSRVTQELGGLASKDQRAA
jgi:hypothetical protein